MDQYAPDMEATPDSIPGLIDLTPQQRNLLLMRPLFQLEFTKHTFSGAAAELRGVLSTIDTHYLCLAALCYMMEGTAVTVGYTLTEVQQYLVRVIAHMRCDLTSEQCTRIADIVIDALDNATNNYQEHACEYFHAPTGTTRTSRFRLTSFEPDLEDIYRYRPTAEGYLLLMGMLDLEVEDHQILIEKMLQLLIERGRFDQAYEFARRARVLSIEHRQQLRDFINQAWRAPGSIFWSRDIGPRLTQARTHIRERQEEDRRMEESVRDQLLRVDAMPAREQLARLHELLRNAGTVRALLQVEVTGAADKFLDAQAGAFKPRRPSGLPDLEAQLLPQALGLPSDALAQHAETILLSLYPAVIPEAPDLSNILAMLFEHRTPDESTEDLDADGSIVPFERYVPPFSDELVRDVHAWIEQRFSFAPNWTIAELLIAAEDEGLSFLERQCIVYALYRSYPDSETLFPGTVAAAEGGFAADVAHGDGLRFTAKGSS